MFNLYDFYEGLEAWMLVTSLYTLVFKEVDV